MLTERQKAGSDALSRSVSALYATRMITDPDEREAMLSTAKSAAACSAPSLLAQRSAVPSVAQFLLLPLNPACARCAARTRRPRRRTTSPRTACAPRARRAAPTATS